MTASRIGLAHGMVLWIALLPPGCAGDAVDLNSMDPAPEPPPPGPAPSEWRCLCPSPPPTEWKSACARGASFLAYLPGPCGGCDPATRTCHYQPVEVPCPDRDAVLPQEELYQIVLRAYLKSLGEKDLDVPLVEFSSDERHFRGEDDLFRTWIAGRSLSHPYGFLSTAGLRAPSQLFLLSSIERRDGERTSVHLRANQFFPISASLFFTSWDYPGNPYRGSAPIRRRAFVSAAVDMMMLDRAHAMGLFTGNLYLSGTMLWLGHVHDVVRDEVPACARAAYQMGLMRMFDRLERWDGNNGNNDMGTPGHLAMWFVARGTGDEEVARRAIAESREELASHYHQAGYLDHGANGFGFDGSYEGISLYFLSWAALATRDEPEYSFLRNTLAQFSRLKAHLTLPEPDEKTFMSPTHYCNATAGGSANDQWAFEHRELAAAMMTDEAKYLVLGGRSGRSLSLPDAAQMKKDISAAFTAANHELTPIPPSMIQPSEWAEQHWSFGMNYAAHDYRPGFYGEMSRLVQERSPLLRPPFLRDSEIIEVFDRDFTVVKLGRGRDTFGVILHTGRLATGWPEPTLPFGFGGGALSAFWTPESGPVLLGMSAGSQNPLPNRWDEWRLWPTHAVSGENAQGKPFSSARLLNPLHSIRKGERSVEVTASGELGSGVDGGTTAPEGALAGTVRYSRSFTLDENGLVVETRLQPNGAPDPIRALYETLPVFHDGAVPARISLVLANGAEVEAQAAPTRSVLRVRIERKGGGVLIGFTRPETVQLSPKEWAINYQVNVKARTLLIDLLDAGGAAAPFPARTIRYTIRKLPPPG